MQKTSGRTDAKKKEIDNTNNADPTATSAGPSTLNDAEYDNLQKVSVHISDTSIQQESDSCPDDPSYIPSDEDETEVNNQTVNKLIHEETVGQDVFHGNMGESRKRKKVADPESWKRKKNKKLRECGEGYLGFRKLGSTILQDQEREKRVMGIRCTSKQCENSKLRHCNLISEEDRHQIFNTFWNKMSWDQKKTFVLSMVDVSVPKRRTTGGDSRRTGTKTYHLKVIEEKKRVCSKMFLNTLGLKEWTVRYWTEMSDDHGMHKYTEGTKVCQSSDRKCSLREFLNSLPKLPSHYCRKSSSKLYLEPVLHSISDLYQIYVNHEKEHGKDPLTRKVFDAVFKEMNISIYKPKKDQCDMCFAYKAGNLSQNEYDEHQVEKDKAREEKNKDKDLSIKGEIHVLAMDLQAVKVCPFLNASALYFKTKLTVHNFTIYDLETHRAVCYWFNESQADLKASVFTSFIVDYVTELIEHDSGKLRPVILYSDGCTYQNRNCTLSNALLRLAMKSKVPILQKFLVKGHTQMEVDSVHAAIERKLKNREIHLPSQYATVTREARLKPFPYEVREVDYNFFKDYSDKNLYMYDSIRPGRVAKDPTVVDIRALKYNPEGTIEFKLSFDDDFRLLPRRPRAIQLVTGPPPLYSSPQKIPHSKFQHLQELKNFIPKDCHHFYDSLDYEK